MESKVHWVVMPKVMTSLMGWPDKLKLSAVQARAVVRVRLGGMGAMRTESFKVACSTVSSLCKLGLLGRDGLTELGQSAADALHESGVNP